MAKKVQNKDLIVDDFLVKSTEQAKAFLIVLDEIEVRLKKSLTASSKVSSKDKGFEKATKDRTDAVEGLRVTQEKRLKTQEKIRLEEARIKKQREKAFDDFDKQKQKEIKATEKAVKLKEKEAKANRVLTGTEEKLIATNKRLTLERRRLNTETKKGRLRLKEINAELDRNNAKIRKNTDALTKQRLNVGNYESALRGAGSALRSLGVGLSVGLIARNVFNVVKDFEQSQANLASILNKATNPELERLEKLSKELGATTKFTAAEVSDLETEFAKLGFSVNEIENVTGATLQLAAATGTELAEAASVAGGTINAFGLGAEQTQRTVDVMAQSFSSSALDMEKFSETMKNAAPIARATGVSLELATAAAGKLADANISGSKAGTDLKKIFSELVKDGKPLEQSLDDISKRMDSAGSNAERLAIAEDLVGDRAKGALLILVDQKDALGELAVELENSGGAAEKMAETQLDTLNGAIALLNSAWEGLILDLEDGIGVFGGLKNAIRFVANNLRTILKVIKTAAIAWLSYRVALKLVNKETGKFRKFGLISFFKKIVLGLKAMAKGGKSAAFSLRGIGKAMKSIPLVAVIAGITTAISLLFDLVTGTTAATKAQNKLNDALREEIELRKEQIEGRRTELGQITERVEAISKLSGAGVKQLSEDITTEIEKLQGELDVVVATVDKFDKKSKDAFTTWGDSETVVSRTKDGLFEVNKVVEEARINSEISKETASETKDELESQLNLLRDQLKVVKGFKPSNRSRTKSIKKQLTGLDKIRAELTKIKKLRDDEFVANKDTTRFQQLNRETQELKDQIEFIEARLKLEEEGFRAKKKEVQDAGTGEDIREIAGEGVFGVAIEDENKNIEAALKRRQELFANAIQAIQEAQQEANAERLEMFDKEIAANDARIEALRGQDTQSAEENLAFARKRQAELEQQKEDEIKRAANTEAALALIGTYQSNIAAGQKPAEALANTAVSAIALKQLISSLDFFWDGTNKTVGEDLGSPLVSGRDGHVVRLDGSEHVVGGNDSASLKSMGADTTGKIVDAAKMVYGGGWQHANMSAMYKAGTKDVDSVLMMKNAQTNNAVVEVLNEVNQSIKNIDMPNINFTWDKLQEGFRKDVETKGKLERFHQYPEKKPWIN